MASLTPYNEIITKTLTDRHLWNYYNSEFNTLSSREFIRSFIKSSGKEQISLYEDLEQLKSGPRLNHIVYTFILGIYLYNKLNHLHIQIDREISRYNKNDSSICFEYIWFLICIFHDSGFGVEEQSKTQIDFISQSIEELQHMHLKNPSGIPRIYKKVYRSYLFYRRDLFNCLDHGIYAGIHLYDELCRIRKKKDDEKDGNLRWSENLINVYNYVAWIVLAHNIFFIDGGKEGETRNYKKYHLDSLITSQKIIKRSRHPVFFLFCLVDTIEPIKVLRKKDLLSNVLFSIDNKSLIIKLLKAGGECKSDYMKRVCDLNKWLTPVTKAEADSVIIKI